MSPSPDPPESRDSSQLKVLVVDDEPTLRLGFTYALSNRRTTVETAATGQQALDRIATTRFDLMILDLRMPEIDGIGVIEALRAGGNPLPIVLCSAALTPNAALRAVRHGVVDFLLKPVRPVDLRQVIEFVIRPENRALPQAMKAARNGRTALAIEILEGEPNPSQQVRHWLDLLTTIRNAEQGEDMDSLELKIKTSMSVLAFNAPSVS